MEQEIKELLPTCSHVMNDVRYEDRKIADNGTAEVHLISAHSLKRICQLDKSDKGHVFVFILREMRRRDKCGCKYNKKDGTLCNCRILGRTKNSCHRRKDK